MAKAGATGKATAAKLGRPSSYRPEYADRMREFFNPEKSKDEKGRPKLPLISGFASHLGVTRDTLHRWSQEFPEFSDAYNSAKEAQEQMLAHHALSGDWNATFAIFTAKNILGWRDKQEVEHSGNVEIKATAVDERL